MAKIFVSFLGTGSPAKKPIGYDAAAYNWPGKSDLAVTVCFAQTAILKILEEKAVVDGPVNKAIFLCTKESKEKHLHALQEELREHLVASVDCVVPEPLVPTDMSPEHQWGWFEQLLGLVGQGDTLIIDFTHGPRSVQLVLSSGIGFLQRAKGITLAHALYGWYAPDPRQPDKVHPIIDMRDFYVINDWAEAVARLADDADARKLGELAKHSEVEALQHLVDDDLIKAFGEMTDCIRNVDVNNIAKKVKAALEAVEQSRIKAESGSARVMLDLVWKKFSTLAADASPSGRYDLAYFRSQLEIINVLLEHRLFMQAFTAMREMVGSIGMAGLTGKYNKQMANADGRKYRNRFAEVFVNMMQYEPCDWSYSGQAETDRQNLMPWFETLRKIGAEQELRRIVKPMVLTRNGFDHAWTSRAVADAEVAEDGRRYLAVLHDVIEQMTAAGHLG